FVLDDDLVEQNLHSTFEVVLRLENGFGRIVRLERTVHFPIEIAAVTRLICVCKLQQSLTAHSPSAYLIGFRACPPGLTDVRVLIQAGFSARKCLEEISPKCTFVGFAHLVKSRAESTDAPGDPRRKHFGRQRLLDDLVPLWIPSRPTELDLLFIDRGRRG